MLKNLFTAFIDKILISIFSPCIFSQTTNNFNFSNRAKTSRYRYIFDLNNIYIPINKKKTFAVIKLPNHLRWLGSRMGEAIGIKFLFSSEIFQPGNNKSNKIETLQEVDFYVKN